MIMEAFCLQVAHERPIQTFGPSVEPLSVFSTVSTLKKNEPADFDGRFCFVLFSFDRRFPKYVKTYSTEELNLLVLYVFTFFGKCLSKENKTKQNRPSAVGFFFFLRRNCTEN